MACCKLTCTSFVLLGLIVTSWTIALGGLGSMNWLVCSDYTTTLKDIQANYATNFPAQTANSAEEALQRLHLPSENSPAATSGPLCSRSWSFEWFCLFFQFAMVVSAAAALLAPNKRFLRARYPVAIMLAISTTIIMRTLDDDIKTVWAFWDTHAQFNEWSGVLQKLYMSAAALAAGWILVIIFNVTFIGVTLDYQEATDCQQ